MIGWVAAGGPLYQTHGRIGGRMAAQAYSTELLGTLGAQLDWG